MWCALSSASEGQFENTPYSRTPPYHNFSCRVYLSCKSPVLAVKGRRAIYLFTPIFQTAVHVPFPTAPQETAGAAGAAGVEVAAVGAAAAAPAVVAGVGDTRRARGAEVRDTLHRTEARRAVVDRMKEGAGKERAPLPAVRATHGTGPGRGRRQAKEDGSGAALPAAGVAGGIRGRRQTLNLHPGLTRDHRPCVRIRV